VFDSVLGDKPVGWRRNRRICWITYPLWAGSSEAGRCMRRANAATAARARGTRTAGIAPSRRALLRTSSRFAWPGSWNSPVIAFMDVYPLI
jgi:hypothetical protein